DSTQQRQALDHYLTAFTTHPDSITENDQYWFTVLAAALKKNDLAFKYLVPLAQLEKDEGGFPGWDLIVGEYSEEDYHNLFSDERWKKLEREALKDQERFYNALREREAEFYSADQTNLKEIEDPEMLFKEIKTYRPYISKQERDYSILYD